MRKKGFSGRLLVVCCGSVILLILPLLPLPKCSQTWLWNSHPGRLSSLGAHTGKRTLFGAFRRDVSQLSGPFGSGPPSSLSFTVSLTGAWPAHTQPWHRPYQASSSARNARAGLCTHTGTTETLPGFAHQSRAILAQRALLVEPTGGRPSC